MAFALSVLHLPLSMSSLIGSHLSAVSVKPKEFDDDQRWLLSGGLGTGTFYLWAFSVLSRTDNDEDLIMPRWLRIGVRLIVAIILVVLTETHEHLETAQFVDTVKNLFVVMTLWETEDVLREAPVFSKAGRIYNRRRRAVSTARAPGMNNSLIEKTPLKSSHAIFRPGEALNSYHNLLVFDTATSQSASTQGTRRRTPYFSCRASLLGLGEDSSDRHICTTDVGTRSHMSEGRTDNYWKDMRAWSPPLRALVGDCLR